MSAMSSKEIASLQIMFWLTFVVCIVVGPAVGFVNVTLHDEKDRNKYGIPEVHAYDALACLWKLLTDSDELLREKALSALENAGRAPEVAIPNIIAAFKLNQQVSVAELANRALLGLGPVAVPAAQKLLREEQDRSMLFRDFLLIKRAKQLVRDLQGETG